MTGGQLSWRERGNLWLRLGIRLILTVLIVWLLHSFGLPLLSLFAPFVAALVVAALLNRPIRWFQRKLGWSRHVLALLIILLVLAAVGGLLGFLVYTAGNELLSLVQNWDVLLEKLLDVLKQLEILFAQLFSLLPEQITASVDESIAGMLDWLTKVAPTALGSLASNAGHKAMGVPSLLVAFIIFLMASYMLSADYPYLRAKCVQSMDTGLRRFLSQVRVTALGAFGGYLKAELLLSIGVFFILIVGFVVIRQPYGLLLALGLSVMDYIPLIGAGTVMVPWAVIALFTHDFTGAAELMIIWGIIVLFRRIMEPKIVGDQTGLSPILTLVSIYVGMRLGGVWGMIFGPVIALIALNLASMGIFHGLRLDFIAAAQDITAILSQRPKLP